MANYFVINKPSNLILKVISLKPIPAETKVEKFIPTSDKAIAVLDKWLLGNPGLLTTVCNWITNHPEADEHDLNEVFGMGVAAAKAYLAKYS